MTTITKNIALYIRSANKDEEAVTTQRLELSKYTDELTEDGTKLHITEFIDSGHSGISTVRPGLQVLLKEAEEGKFDLIIATDVSRLSRNYPVLQELITALGNTGAVVDFCTSRELLKEIDLDDDVAGQIVQQTLDEAEDDLENDNK